MWVVGLVPLLFFVFSPSFVFVFVACCLFVFFLHFIPACFIVFCLLSVLAGLVFVGVLFSFLGSV